MSGRLISCDDHMDLSQLPADLWTTRLPASLLDRAPHVEERDGQAVWVCDGKVWGRWDGKPPATSSARPIKALYNAFDRAGIHDPSARRPAVAELRLADMDRDGVTGWKHNRHLCPWLESHLMRFETAFSSTKRSLTTFRGFMVWEPTSFLDIATWTAPIRRSCILFKEASHEVDCSIPGCSCNAGWHCRLDGPCIRAGG